MKDAAPHSLGSAFWLAAEMLCDWLSYIYVAITKYLASCVKCKLIDRWMETQIPHDVLRDSGSRSRSVIDFVSTYVALSRVPRTSARGEPDPQGARGQGHLRCALVKFCSLIDEHWRLGSALC